VKDWLKRKEILSLFATGSQAVAITPPQMKVWVAFLFCVFYCTGIVPLKAA
jgi:hypothetical protein